MKGMKDKGRYSFATLWQTFAIMVAKLCQSAARYVSTLCINAFDLVLPKVHQET